MMAEQETVTLSADNGFPAVVARKGTAANFAAMAAEQKLAYGFSLDRANVVAALRLLADQIEAAAALPQTMTDSTTAQLDDFVLRTVTVTYAARREDVENPA